MSSLGAQGLIFSGSADCIGASLRRRFEESGLFTSGAVIRIVLQGGADAEG
jgi:hypothetical protein